MLSKGFYARRRGLLDHLRSGRIGLFDAGVHDYLCMRANPFVNGDGSCPPGVWIGSAAAIEAECPRQSSERQIRRSLEHLEQTGWIKRWMTNGKRGNYPILVARLSVFDPAGKEFRVNAEETTDWRSPVLVPCREVSGRCPGGVRDMSGNKRIDTGNTDTHPVGAEAPGVCASTSQSTPKPAKKPDWTSDTAKQAHDHYRAALDKEGFAEMGCRLTGAVEKMLRRRAVQLAETVQSQDPEMVESEVHAKVLRLMSYGIDRFVEDDWNAGRAPAKAYNDGRPKARLGLGRLFKDYERMADWINREPKQ